MMLFHINLLRFVLWPETVPILMTLPKLLEKNMYSAIWGVVLYKFQLGQLG